MLYSLNNLIINKTNNWIKENTISDWNILIIDKIYHWINGLIINLWFNFSNDKVKW